MRLVYNLALEQREQHWRQFRAATGQNISWITQEREVTVLRAEFPFIAACPRYPLSGALRDLERAFGAFFAGRAHYPSFRRKGENESFRFQGPRIRTRKINRRWSAARLPCVGWVRYRDSRAITGTVQNVTITQSGGGWFISFACAIEHEAPANDNPSVGIDRGITNTLALSTGEVFSLPASLAALDRRKRRAQRVMARRKRGSRRYAKQRKRVAGIAARIARVRADWQHRVSLDIASRFGLVVLEKLNVKGMTAKGRGKRGLNRSILEQGWSALAAKLAYKLEERGGALVSVHPAYSSQTCSDCGAVDKASRKSQADFACTSCGLTINADHNAAIIILRRSTPAMPVEGRGYAPVEAGTCLEAA